MKRTPQETQRLIFQAIAILKDVEGKLIALDACHAEAQRRIDAGIDPRA